MLSRYFLATDIWFSLPDQFLSTTIRKSQNSLNVCESNIYEIVFKIPFIKISTAVDVFRRIFIWQIFVTQNKVYRTVGKSVK